MSTTLINLNQNQLNQSDPTFAEVIKATNEGKEALANALTEKGIETNSDILLSEMANRVSSLQIKDDYQEIRTILPTEAESSFQFSSAGYTNIFRVPAKLANIVTAGGIMYYVPMWYDTSTSNNPIDHALFSIDLSEQLPATNVPYQVAITNDGNHIAFCRLNTNNVYIYEIEEHNFTFVKSYTTKSGINFANDSHSVVAMSNDCKLIQYKNILENMETGTYASNSNISTDSNTQTKFIKNNKLVQIYVTNTASNRSYNVICTYFDYNIDETTGSITFGSSVTKQNNKPGYNVGNNFQILVFSDDLIIAKSENTTPYGIVMDNIADTSYFGSKTCFDPLTNGIPYYTDSTWYPEYRNRSSLMPKSVDLENKIIVWSGPANLTDITTDFENAIIDLGYNGKPYYWNRCYEISSNPNNTESCYMKYNGNSAQFHRCTLFGSTTSKKFITSDTLSTGKYDISWHAGNYSSDGVSYMYVYSMTEKPQRVGVKITINGGTRPLLMPSIILSDINAGYYEVDESTSYLKD